MENLGDSSTPHTGSILYGTVHGAIGKSLLKPQRLFVILFCIFFPLKGMVTQIPSEFFEFLTNLQQRLRKVIKSVGKIDHDEWRSFSNERRTTDMEVENST